MIRRPPRSTLDRSSAASDVYKRQVYTPSVIKLELKGSTTVDISNAYFDNNGFGSNGSILIPWSSSFYGEIGDEWSWEIEEKDGAPDALIIANQYQNGILISTDTAYGAGSSLNLNGTVPVSYTHLRAHETVLDLVCRLLIEKTKTHTQHTHTIIK